MNLNLITFIAMITVFLSYVSFIWLKYGIQKSISISYYALPNNLKYLFTLFCWGFAFPAIILGIQTTWLMFFAGAGIVFVGATSRIREKDVFKIHMFAAVAGIIFSQLAIFFGYHMLWLNIASIALAALSLLSKKHYFWWIELVAFTSVCVAIASTLF